MCTFLPTLSHYSRHGFLAPATALVFTELVEKADLPLLSAVVVVVVVGVGVGVATGPAPVAVAVEVAVVVGVGVCLVQSRSE